MWDADDGTQTGGRSGKDGDGVRHPVRPVGTDDRPAPPHDFLMDYEAVYLPKNHFIKEESMRQTNICLCVLPLRPAGLGEGIASTWNVSGDRTMVALTMTFMDEPIAKNMSFQREYAEPYDWVAQQFKDWAFTLSTSILYYNDYDSIDEDARGLYRKAMAAFGGIASQLPHRVTGQAHHLLGFVTPFCWVSR